MSGFSVFSEDSNSPEVLEERNETRKHLSNLFLSEEFSDVTFVVNNKEFRAHKNILSRFDYFYSMFKNWEAGKENKISISGIAPDVFNLVLEFIYRHRLSDWSQVMEKHSTDLIVASNMFGIDGLRKSCEKYIIRAEKINVSNGCEYLILADVHNAPKLKAVAAKFISDNLEEVKKTPGYKDLKRHSSFGVDLLEILSTSKRQRLN